MEGGAAFPGKARANLFSMTAASDGLFGRRDVRGLLSQCRVGQVTPRLGVRRVWALHAAEHGHNRCASDLMLACLAELPMCAPCFQADLAKAATFFSRRTYPCRQRRFRRVDATARAMSENM